MSAKKKNKKTPASAVKSSSSPSRDASSSAAITNALSRWHAIGEVQRRAFMKQHDPTRAAELGAETKSDGVLRDVVAWIPAIEKALRAHVAALPYSEARFVFLLECADTLVRKRAAQTAGATASSEASAARSHALGVARAARNNLKHFLDQLSMGNVTAQNAVSRAALEGEHPDDVAHSITLLVSLANGWLARTSEEDKALVASSGLTPEIVAQAEDAANALTATTEAAVGTKKVWRDGPEVNDAEGDVLLEMRYAFNDFKHARDRDPTIAALVAGPNTKHVLAPAPAKKAKATTAAGASAGGGAPATTVGSPGTG